MARTSIAFFFSFLLFSASQAESLEYEFITPEGYRCFVTVAPFDEEPSARMSENGYYLAFSPPPEGAHVWIRDLLRTPAGRAINGHPTVVYSMDTVDTPSGTAYHAYYRDAFTGVSFNAIDAVEGDTWDTKSSFVQSMGDLWPGERPFTVSLPQVKFHFYVSRGPDGYPAHDCFAVGGFPVQCGYTSAVINFSVDTQCSPPGDWEFSVMYNGGMEIVSQAFNMNPSVPPQDLLRMSQGIDYPYDDINSTIRQSGCALTSAAMVLYYHGERFGQNPFTSASGAVITLNNWLKYPNDGFKIIYDEGGNIKRFTGDMYFPKAAEYSKRVESAGRKTGVAANSDTLKQQICSWSPQVLKVNRDGGSHFVVATGRVKTSDSWTWKIMDPGEASVNDLGRYNHQYSSIRNYRGVSDPADVIKSPSYDIEFYLASPAELLVTAPDGKKTGIDPIAGREYAQIPDSGYELEDYATPVKILHINDAMNGEYTVQVIGTGTGDYYLMARVYYYQGELKETSYETYKNQTPITPGEVHQYAYQFTAGSTVAAPFTGGFDGGGQRPADVNKFLRYARPAQARTELPAGTQWYTMSITYGPAIKPETFYAELDGIAVTDMFNPAPGKTEDVELSLGPGSQTFVLSVDGVKDSGQTATDTDRLTFIVK